MGGFIDTIVSIAEASGLGYIINNFWDGGWQNVVMIVVACVLLYLAIVKKYEPLLLLPIAFGMLLANLPLANLTSKYTVEGLSELLSPESLEAVKASVVGGWENLSESAQKLELMGALKNTGWKEGLIYYLYKGVDFGIYPPLIFIGIGAMTDFGPLISNPKSLLLGAAAQVGIFVTYLGARILDSTGLIAFSQADAGAIGIIGGADGPTAIFTASKLAPELLPAIAVAAYSYMALVPVIQPPIMKALTTKKERAVVMKQTRAVSKTEKIIFPIFVTIFIALILPDAATLVGCLMLGNLIKESGVCDRLCKTVQNELMNIVTIFLGISVGATATGTTFLKGQTLGIIALGVIAFGMGTATGILFGKIMYVVTKGKVNPLIGSAGVSAVPMAARVAQKVGQEENPNNYLLMHAMGPNVAGVIGSAIAAGVLINMLG
ncbi:MAG: sodium ion-translocating decarboxylase subunit beta [Ruminococcaceae bacterium]|nr:sodium ion-translocating decarboxylase subunit beta [Oscillospiraceae bacterium]